MTSPSALRIKSYFASSVDAAIAQAREELGTEALLLNTRKFSGDAGQPAGYEVVFGVPGTQDAAATPSMEFRGLLSESRQRNESVYENPLGLREARVEPRRQPIQQPVQQPVQQNRPELRQNVATARSTAATKPAEIRASRPLRTEPIARPAGSQQTEDLGGELEKLHAQINEIRSLIVKSSAPQIAVGRTVPELPEVYNRLISSGVDVELAKDIVDRLEATMSTDAFFLRGDGSKQADGPKAANRWKTMRFDAARLEAFVRSELECRVPIEPLLGGDGEHSAVVVMVGPTGAGKTTSIMKLAASDRVARRRVRILSLDTTRPGQNHLQSFASNLGIAYSSVQSVHALPAMVAQVAEKELVFIDTPGYSNTGDRSAEIAALTIGKIQPANFRLDIHLVAPGYMKGSDLRRCIQKYEVFRPSRMLVTKLDDTDTLGSVYSEASRAGLALSFFASGTAIPEDIRPAATEDLLSLAFERKAARAQCA